jgi:hypothetical protein
MAKRKGITTEGCHPITEDECRAICRFMVSMCNELGLKTMISSGLGNDMHITTNYKVCIERCNLLGVDVQQASLRTKKVKGVWQTRESLGFREDVEAYQKKCAEDDKAEAEKLAARAAKKSKK